MNEIKLEEKQLGDWSSVAELDHYAIVRTSPQGLLGVPMADVLFKYKRRSNQKLEDQKALHLYGEEGTVYKRSLEIIERKKNPMLRKQMVNRFIDEFNLTKFKPTNYFFGKPHTLLGRAIQNSGSTTKSFAEKAKIAAPSLYHHVSGGREISRDVAIEYSKKLNCDPVDLMFEKKSIPVWSKCNLLKTTELEDNYRPGRLFSYAADDKLEKVVVPRDIYRSDIKAIKVEAKGSMYNNKVAFYYRATDKEQNIVNQLCVVGVETIIGPEDLSNDTEERFYFGLYEENQGESNLLNPDPFAKADNKYILKDFTPIFVSPIILVLNPEAVVDQTKLKHSIPDEALVRKEEELKSQIDFLKKMVRKGVADREVAMEFAEHTSKNAKQEAVENSKRIDVAQGTITRLMSEVEKITLRINQEIGARKRGLFDQINSFEELKKVGTLINKNSKDKLKIISGGKK